MCACGPLSIILIFVRKNDVLLSTSTSVTLGDTGHKESQTKRQILNDLTCMWYLKLPNT